MSQTGYVNIFLAYFLNFFLFQEIYKLLYYHNKRFTFVIENARRQSYILMLDDIPHGRKIIF